MIANKLAPFAAALMLSAYTSHATATVVMDTTTKSATDTATGLTWIHSVSLDAASAQGYRIATADEMRVFIDDHMESFGSWSQYVQGSGQFDIGFMDVYGSEWNLFVPFECTSKATGCKTVGSVDSDGLYKTMTFDLQVYSKPDWNSYPDARYLGSLADVATVSPSLDGFYMVRSVPEPTTWIMLVLGLGMIGRMARRNPTQ